MLAANMSQIWTNIGSAGAGAGGWEHHYRCYCSDLVYMSTFIFKILKILNCSVYVAMQKFFK